MISKSPELAAIVGRWNEAVRTGDRGTIENLLSADNALRYIGTAWTEFWDADLLRRGLGDHFAEVPEFHYGENELEAYENGSTGWAVWKGQINFATTGVNSDYRISFIFVLESGSWKIIQMHLSNPTSNIEKMGIEHSALPALVEAAKKGSLGLGREGMATIMFTDVVDSSALADVMGDRAWIGRIDAHLDKVRRSVEKAGGTLVKSLGDGTMSTFVSTRSALTAATEIQREAFANTQTPVIRLRIGLHTGEVIENKGDFFGTVVNKAARINAVTAPDEIRLSHATHIMLGRTDGFDFDDPIDVPLKGLEGTHRLYRLKI